MINGGDHIGFIVHKISGNLMARSEIEEAIKLVQGNPQTAHFVGPRSETLICQAEQALDCRFPPSYKLFLLELGCGSFAGEEFYGIVDDNFESASVPNGIWLTLQFRGDAKLPQSLVIVCSSGFGPYYAINTSQVDEQGECPIVDWVPGVERADIVDKSFGAFFLNSLRKALDAKHRMQE